MGPIEESDGRRQEEPELRRTSSLIGAALKIEHHEVWSYTTAGNQSYHLPMRELARLIQMSLAGEENADVVLDQISRSLNSTMGMPASVI